MADSELARILLMAERLRRRTRDNDTITLCDAIARLPSIISVHSEQIKPDRNEYWRNYRRFMRACAPGPRKPRGRPRKSNIASPLA